LNRFAKGSRARTAQERGDSLRPYEAASPTSSSRSPKRTSTKLSGKRGGLEIAEALDFVPRDEVPDMPDRIIAATAVSHMLPLVSQDSEIRASATLNALVPAIW
jgi:hypothetical protein